MKKQFTILVCAFLIMVSTQVSAQLSTFVDVNHPCWGLALNGNDLYIGTSTGKIFKTNITETNPTLEEIISTPFDIKSIALHNNDLYIGGIINAIYKIDISQANPTTSIVVDNVNSTRGLFVKDNELLFSKIESGEVVKINLMDANPTQTVIVDGLAAPEAIIPIGDALYVAEFLGGKIDKIDLSGPMPVVETIISGLTSPSAIIPNGNFIYVTETFANRVSRIDITSATPSVELVTEGLSSPRFCAFDGVDLFIAEEGANKVSKLIINQPVLPTSLMTCSNGNLNSINGGASPTGGVYSGTNIIDNGNGETFTLNTSTVGSYDVNYMIGSETVSSTINVIDPAPVTLTLPDTLFVVNGDLPMGIGGGMPAGGVYSDPYNEITDDGNGMTFSVNSTVMTGLDNAITYTYVDANGCTNSAVVTIHVADVMTSVQDISKANIQIFPNPTTGFLQLENVDANEVTVFDNFGKAVMTVQQLGTSMDISALPTGFYILKIATDDGVFSAKVIKE